MNVTFYTFSKRINSTKQPGGGASYSCTLKEPCGVLSPTISLVWSGSGSPAAFNYAYIPTFSRYYWVKEWTYANRQWTARLDVDVLASYKSQIGSAEKYVLRAASEYDPYALDTFYPVKAFVKSAFGIAGSSVGWASFGNGGTFVVSVVGSGNASSANGVSQYMMSGTSVQALINNQINAIDGAANNATAADVKEAIIKLLQLPFRFTSDLSQYIRSIMWYPFSFPAGSGGPVYLGMFQCLTAASNVASPVYANASDIDVTLLHTMASGEYWWEYAAPYATYTLEWEPWGVIPLDPVDVLNSDTIRCAVRIDSISGLGILLVYGMGGAGDYRLLATRTAQLGVMVPYGGTAPNYAGAITGAVGIAAAATAYSAGEGSKAAIAGSIGNAISSADAVGYSSGTSGGGAAIDITPSLDVKVRSHVDTDPDEFGMPLCKVRTLSDLEGYIKTQDGDIQAPATDAELMQIENYLTGGFFYE